ncbi:ATP-binding protein [Candidatus Woesearchaeota archaeon]|nr:ATP-binding protein [Candidatus Woesearchaeota archaeon]
MKPQNLPLGINTLSLLRENQCIYVDKTGLAHRLVRLPGRFFLSRPRRFGKSLFIDTLKEIFEGNENLFRGLHIHDCWDWSRTFPVIKIDFAGGVLKSREELDRRILDIFQKNADHLGVSCEAADIPGKLETLIIEANRKYGQRAVILVDEYDKPILDNIDNPSVAAEMHEGLKNLYSVFKQQDANLHFVFMTGVTKFSRVSLFSGMNQLTDITLSREFSTLCGYTQQDLEHAFAEHLHGVDREKLRKWYNGYSWRGESVYNPYDILLFIHQGLEYGNYWFETGSPSFLIKLFEAKRYFLPDLEQLEVSGEILESFEVEHINPVTLLFQSGYLTIAGSRTRGERTLFTLKIPNMEVRLALNDRFINAYSGLENQKNSIQDALYDGLEQGNVESLVKAIKRLFAGIPWRNLTHNDMAHFEGYYASVLYAFLASLNAHIIPEDITNHGQADMTAILGSHIYVLEIKVVDGETVDGNPALQQIIQCNYAEKYRGRAGFTVHEVGLVFSRTQRNLIQADHSPHRSNT